MRAEIQDGGLRKNTHTSQCLHLDLGGSYASVYRCKKMELDIKISALYTFLYVVYHDRKENTKQKNLNSAWEKPSEL